MAAYTGELVDTPDVPVAKTEKAVSKAKAKSAPIAAAVPTPVVSTAPLAGDAVERVVQNVGKAGALTTNAVSDATSNAGDVVNSFLANNPYLPAAVVGLLGGGYVAKKAADAGLFDTLGSKMSSSAAQPMVGGSGPRNTAAPIQEWGIHDEPPLFAPAAAPEVTAAPAAAPSRNLTLEEAQARMAGVTPAASEMVGPIAPVGPPKPIAPSAAPNSAATQAVTETIQQLGQAETPVAAMPSRPVTPTPAAALPTGELRTGSGLPAYAGEGKPRERFPKEFKSTADIPKGYAFVPGMGAGTNVIRNDFGQAGYNALVQEQGGPFGADKETREFIKKYNEERMGPPATRELRKKLDLPLPENTKGIPMKIAKVGGVVGAIMAIPELANAAENRDVGQAANVASGFLPPAMQALIYSGGLNAGAEEENRQLRMRDYALKAGRGVAQGYDPRKLIGVAPPAR